MADAEDPHSRSCDGPGSGRPRSFSRRTGVPRGTLTNGGMGPRDACGQAVEVVVEKGGAGGETKAPCGFVDEEALARIDASGRVRVEVTLGSATSWDRPVDRSYLVRVRRGELAVVVGWSLSRRSAESLAERVAELLGLGNPFPGRPAA